MKLAQVDLSPTLSAPQFSSRGRAYCSSLGSQTTDSVPCGALPRGDTGSLFTRDPEPLVPLERAIAGAGPRFARPSLALKADMHGSIPCLILLDSNSECIINIYIYLESHEQAPARRSVSEKAPSQAKRILPGSNGPQPCPPSGSTCGPAKATFVASCAD